MNRQGILFAGAALITLTACGSMSEDKLAENATNVQTIIGGPETSEGDAVDLSTKGPKLKPGLWETSTEVNGMKVEGGPSGTPAGAQNPGAMSNVQIPKTTVRTCLTPEQAANPRGNMLAAQKDRNCDIKTMDWTGGKMKVVMICTAKDGSGTANINMRGTFNDSSYAMDGDMAMSGPNGMQMTMKTHTTGKYVGACES
jgi:hypothetical protein